MFQVLKFCSKNLGENASLLSIEMLERMRVTPQGSLRDRAKAQI